MKTAKQLLEEYNKIEQGLEISETVRYNESNQEEKEIILSKREYAVVMSTLETWLRNSKNYRNKIYIRKEISIENLGTFAYTYKKVGNYYIIIDKEVI